MSLFLGIDLGTQSAKALVYDAALRRVVGRGSFPFAVDAPRPGAAEQDPREWLAGGEFAAAQALAAAAVDPGAVRGVAVSGQQHGLVALDEHDRVIRPAKLWCDTETAAEAAELSALLGRNLPAGFTASKILWLKRREPEHFRRLRRVLLPHDYFNLYLTGRACMEAGDASGTGFFDFRARRFDARAMAAIDPELAQRLPPLVGPDAAIGTVRPEIAGRLGLRSDVLVAPGSGDNMMSAIGAGAVAEGVLVVSLGTSGTVFARAAAPVEDREGYVAPFCDATGAWLPLLCTMNCTTVTEAVRAAFPLDHEEIARLAAAEPLGCGGLRFLPYLAGERAPNWPHASGVLHGLRADSLRPGLLYRAAMEGATLALLHGWLHMEKLGVEGREMRLVGGGSRNTLWSSMICDAFGLPLRRPQETESAALGAALQAAAVAGGRGVARFVHDHGVPLAPEIVEPQPARTAAYRTAATSAFDLAERLFGGAPPPCSPSSSSPR